MKRLGIFVLMVSALGFSLTLPALGIHVKIELTAPEHAVLGADSEVTVRLTDADTSSPVAGAQVVLYQTSEFGGESGRIELAHAKTDGSGMARLRWVQRSSGSQDLMVEYLGPEEFTPESAQIHVDEGPQQFQSVEGIKLPGVGASSVIGLLVILWGTLFLAASMVFVIAGRGKEDPGTDWIVEPLAIRNRFAIPALLAVFVLGLASTLLIVVVRNPQTHGNLGTPQGYQRTPVAFLNQSETYTGYPLESPIEAADAAAEGRALYVAYGCAACHGLDAEGGVVGASLRNRNAEALEAAARFGPLGMPAFDQVSLPRTDIEKIAAYVNSFGGPPTTEPVDGGQVYTQFCASCHGSDAEGDFGPALAGTSLQVEQIADVITSGRDQMPGWGGTLSKEQMQAVARYVSSLAAPSDTPEPSTNETAGLFADSCAGCHGTDGVGGFAPELAGTALSAEDLTTVIANGRNGMPAFTSLTERQISDLAAYILGL